MTPEGWSTEGTTLQYNQRSRIQVARSFTGLYLLQLGGTVPCSPKHRGVMRPVGMAGYALFHHILAWLRGVPAIRLAWQFVPVTRAYVTKPAKQKYGRMFEVVLQEFAVPRRWGSVSTAVGTMAEHTSVIRHNDVQTSKSAF